MLAAGRAAELGVDVLLLEKMPEPGKKLMISGKTRCNLTNSADLDEFISAYGSNGKFLFPAFHKFFRPELLDLMRSIGIETKVERGGRIFPVSDNASDVVDALKWYLKINGVKITPGVRVMGITTDAGRVTGVKTAKKDYPATAVVLATGGASFPETGSEGDGYRIAQELGHTIIKLRPSLVPLYTEEIKGLDKEGVTLRNITLTAYKCRADDISNVSKRMVIDKRFGEITLTRNCIRGPIALQMSLAIVKALESGAVSLEIDLKPALSTIQLKARLQREFDRAGKRSLRTILKELLPVKLIEPLILLSKIPGEKTANQINAREKEKLATLMKMWRLNVLKSFPLEAAMVTSGGVALNEIDPGTMASRIIRGLFFCGEVIDIDAETGGYNLQAAFSTGYLAGESAASYIRSLPV